MIATADASFLVSLYGEDINTPVAEEWMRGAAVPRWLASLRLAGLLEKSSPAGIADPEDGECEKEAQENEEGDIADPEGSTDIQFVAELNINEPMPGTSIPIVSLYNQHWITAIAEPRSVMDRTHKLIDIAEWIIEGRDLQAGKKAATGTESMGCL